MERSKIVELLNKGESWVLFYEHFKTHGKINLSRSDFRYIFDIWKFRNPDVSRNFLQEKMHEYNIVVLIDIQKNRIIRYE